MKWWTVLLAVTLGVNISTASVIIHTKVDESSNCVGITNGKIEYSSDSEPTSGCLIRKIHEAFMKTLYTILTMSGGDLKMDFVPAKSKSELPCREDGKATGIEYGGSDGHGSGGQISVPPVDINVIKKHDQILDNYKIQEGPEWTPYVDVGIEG